MKTLGAHSCQGSAPRPRCESLRKTAKWRERNTSLCSLCSPRQMLMWVFPLFKSKTESSKNRKEKKKSYFSWTHWPCERCSLRKQLAEFPHSHLGRPHPRPRMLAAPRTCPWVPLPHLDGDHHLESFRILLCRQEPEMT